MSDVQRLTAIPFDVDAFVFSESLPRKPESAAVARRRVRTVLGGWHLPELSDCAVLIVTELVANAAEHARGSYVRVTVTRTGEHRVRVAVVDKDHNQPRPRLATVDDERGRGLQLVDALSDVWGVDPLPWGKRVWADVEEA